MKRPLSWTCCAQAITGGTATLVTGGRVVASARIPPLEAPADLTPRTTTLTMTLPAGTDPRAVEAIVTIDGDVPEVTRRNNSVRLTVVDDARTVSGR